MTTKTSTLNSGSVIEQSCFAQTMIDDFNTLLDSDLGTAGVYRRFDIYDDNITGDTNRATYTDYTIKMIVQLQQVNDRLVVQGRLAVNDAEIFIPARITETSDDTAIVEDFRPKLRDYIIWQGYTFLIESIDYTTFGQYEVYAGCLCKRKDNANPEVAWNSAYVAPGIADPGKGFD